jgi:hypothetical protein
MMDLQENKKTIGYGFLIGACIIGIITCLAIYFSGFSIWGGYPYIQSVIAILALIGWKIECDNIGINMLGMEKNIKL